MYGTPGTIVAQFQSKAPHTTNWLYLEYQDGDEPSQLLSDLAAVGWTEDLWFKARPPFNGRKTTTVSRDGTGLFKTWTPGERKAAMIDARKVLRKHRIKASVAKLTMQDLI